jgi:calcineurin-like phosphoesterase family protein
VHLALLRNIVEWHSKYAKIQFEDYQEKFLEPLSSSKTFPDTSSRLNPRKNEHTLILHGMSHDSRRVQFKNKLTYSIVC